MIDFRYHVVSLVSVFLALAVGIILGAGPLQQPIGDSLTGQVEKLRETRNTLQKELDSTRIEVNDRNDFIAAAAPQLLAGTLGEQGIALVTLPGVQVDDVTSIRETITQAGGIVTAEISLTPNWTELAKTQYRSTLVGQLGTYLSQPPGASDVPEQILAQALGQLLTEKWDETLVSILTTAGDELISVKAAPTQMARATVIVAPRSQAPAAADGKAGDAESQAALDSRDAAYTMLAQTLSLKAGGTVVIGAALNDGDLVSVLRAKAAGVSTVDGIGKMPSAVSLPLALANSINGTIGAWGFADSAQSPLPPKVVAQAPAPPPQPETPEEPAPEGSGG
ncbi:MAG: copper transporter [Actinomycetaceae bacterium]|nr:copper transporter [Actinomycetaceae bacterium]